MAKAITGHLRVEERQLLRKEIEAEWGLEPFRRHHGQTTG